MGLEKNREPDDDARESMWSIPRRFARVYFILFSALGIVGIVWSAWYEIAHNSAGKSWYDIVNATIEKFPSVLMGAAFISFIITETVMVLYSIYQDRMKKRYKRIRAEGVAEGRAEGVVEGRAEGVAEGRAEGVAQGIALIEAYYRRKSEAEARGEVFDEPYPGSASENGTGRS